MYQMNRPWLTLQKLSIKKAILLFRMIQPSILCKYLPLYTQFNQNRLGLDGRILPDLKVIIFCPIVILAIKLGRQHFCRIAQANEKVYVNEQQQNGGVGGDISSDISDSRYRLLVSRHNSLRHRSRGIIRTFSITSHYQHYTSTRCKQLSAPYKYKV